MLPAMLLLAATAVAGSPTWSQVTAGGWAHHATREHADAGTVQVYHKVVSGVDCLQGVAETTAGRDLLLQVAADIPGTRKWSSAGVAEAEVLGRGSGTLDYYQLLDVPGWTMASDRFWFLHGVISRTADTTVFRWDRLDTSGTYAARYEAVRAAHPDAIEPPVNVGGWVLTDIPTGTRIQYYVCTDTGGAIPAAVQKAASSRTLPDTVGDLVREAKRRSP